jgi:hypothetical protein
VHVQGSDARAPQRWVEDAGFRRHAQHSFTDGTVRRYSQFITPHSARDLHTQKTSTEARLGHGALVSETVGLVCGMQWQGPTRRVQQTERNPTQQQQHSGPCESVLMELWLLSICLLHVNEASRTGGT